METNDNNIYCPTKIQLVGYEHNLHHGYGPGNFQLKIGNSSSNEWIDCNQQLLTGQKKANQTFNLDIKHGNKWKNIKQKQFKQFKLEILNNLGNPDYILITEFKLFGVKI
eukprot:324394_1